ncbi:MAG TPA: ATP synthase F1 subunit gamma [Bryobacterales bacterium]|jgi:F-type H+-transporting ATPase subunit gamma|nr:ATP synthase F1 subunit gamma [Bryobacterales bacterium]
MPSLIDIRRRIRSVRNTQQITKAMKMVSAAKLRRAQDRVIAARPYAALIREVMANLVAHARIFDEEHMPPLLARRPENRILLMLLTGDKGLCGAFNTNLIKASQSFLAEHSAARVELELIGRKGRDYYRRRQTPVSGEYVNVFAKVEYSVAREIAQKAIQRFTFQEIDAVYLLYNEFKSVLSQKLVVDRILPLHPPEGREAPVDPIYEEPPEAILRYLLPKYVEVQVYHAMIESAAAEHAARMTAMDSATSNAADMIDSLTLYLNRVRQASITKEIIEVVSGAAAAAQ